VAYEKHETYEKDIKETRWQRLETTHLIQGGGQWQGLADKSMNFSRSIIFVNLLSS
jgi:hypothetical protein